jgi:predicted DNA-binding transcriptional regulator AlpA
MAAGEVEEECRFSRMTLIRRMRDSNFPQPFRLGAGRQRLWLRSEVLEWLEAQHRRQGRKP